MVLLQALHLLRRNAEKAEHTDGTNQVREVMRRCFILERIIQHDAHFLQPAAHFGQLDAPGSFELRVVENHIDDDRAVIRWHRVNRAYNVIDLAVHNVTSGRIGRQHGQRSDAIPVKAKIL